MKFLFFIFIVGSALARNSYLVELTEENWKEILKDEWMIEFHAPWCPACKDLQKSWDSFATWSKDLSIQVGAIDVTANPGLSGRFLVTALPTIYHVKDGQFRLYQGPRDKNDFINFVEERKWTVVDPLPSWKNPESVQMSIVASFFRASMHVRDLHTHLVEKRGLPPVASYALFGGATLFLGCILGFIIVLLIDFVFPATPKASKEIQQKDNKKDMKQDSKKKQQDMKKKRDSEHGSQSELSQASSAESGDESAVKNRKAKQTPKKENKQDKKEETKKKK